MDLVKLRDKYGKKELDKPSYISLMHTKYQELFQLANYLKEYGSDIESIKVEKKGVKFITKEKYVFVFSPYDTRCAPIEALNFSIYENEDSKWIYRLVKNGDAIFDIGANIGWYSVHLAKKFPESNIYAFEPIPETFEYLNKNINLNEVDNINAYNLALSNEQGEQDLFFEKDNSARASLANLSENDAIVKISSKLERLDTFVLQLNGMIKVDFIKCDCEGAELLVFKGAKNVIYADKPIVFTEMLRKWSAKFGYHPNDIINFFGELGYSCFYSNLDKLAQIDEVNDSTIETNFIFLHRGKHKSVIRNFSKD